MIKFETGISRPATGFRMADVEVVAVPAENSIGFLDTVFECTAGGQVFAIDRGQCALEAHVSALRQARLPEPARRGWIRLRYTPVASDALAQITFSSGTEGRPKAILLSQRNIADVVTRLNTAMQLSDEILEYVGVPVTYSFGLGRVRAVSAAGGAVYLPERFDPTEIRQMLDAGDINAISAVPSLWRTLLAAPEVIGQAGRAVRWIEIGSQYMSAEEKVAMTRLFPNARIVQHYGLTEASRSTLLDISNADPAQLDSVGQAVGSVEIGMAPSGAIRIRGDHVARGILDQDTGEIRPLTDAEGWFETRDKGRIEAGHLFYLGRLDDQINVAGVKLWAEALERAIVAELPAAERRVAISRVPDPARGEAVLLAYETGLGDRAALLRAAADLVLRRHGIDPRGALVPMALDNLPRTGTDKIQRGRLAQIHADLGPVASADDGHAPGETESPTLTAGEAQVAESWQKVLGRTDLTPDSTFYDAGGDSLGGVQISLVMDRQGYSREIIRATLEGRSLRAVAALLDRASTASTQTTDPVTGQTAQNWSVSMTRGVMVLAVLFSHWGPGVFVRLGLADVTDRIFGAFYRIGTPGFAFVFGLGIGAFMLPRYTHNAAAVMGRLKVSFLLVLSGLVLSGGVFLLRFALGGPGISGQTVSHAFYNVLAYYVIILGSARLWVPRLARLRRPVVGLAVLAIMFWIAWQIALALITQTPQNSLLEWPRLMGVAGYNVFKMSAIACAGAAFGLWVATRREVSEIAGSLVVAGTIGCFLSIATLLQGYGLAAFAGRDSPAYMTLPGLTLYMCFAVALTGLFWQGLLRWDSLPPVLRVPMQILVVVGGMALPIYVFHGLVIPVKDVLILLGTPSGLALAGPLILFLAGMGYGGVRLYKMYYR